MKKFHKIKDIRKYGEALLKAEDNFKLWMDVCQESESRQQLLDIQKAHDDAMDKIGLNPKK